METSDRAEAQANFKLRAGACCSIFSLPLWKLPPSGISLMADTIELVPELLEAGVHFGHRTKLLGSKDEASDKDRDVDVH